MFWIIGFIQRVKADCEEGGLLCFQWDSWSVGVGSESILSPLPGLVMMWRMAAPAVKTAGY